VETTSKIVSAGNGFSLGEHLTSKLGRMFDSVQDYLELQKEHVREKRVVEVARLSADLGHRHGLRILKMEAMEAGDIDKALVISAMLEPNSAIAANRAAASAAKIAASSDADLTKTANDMQTDPASVTAAINSNLSNSLSAPNSQIEPRTTPTHKINSKNDNTRPTSLNDALSNEFFSPNFSL